MYESILDTIRDMVMGISCDNSFDTDLILFINAAFGELTQIGVGPSEGFMIEDNSTVWEEYVTDPVILGMVKEFIYLKVRITFDPPNSSVLNAYQQILDRLTWRLNVESSYKEAINK